MIDLSILRQIFVNFENSSQSKINFCQYVKTLVLEVYGRAGHDGHDFWLRHCLPLSGADRGFFVTMAFLGLGPHPSYLLDTPTIWANAVTMCFHSRFVFISFPSNTLFLFPSKSSPLKTHYRGLRL